MHSFSRRAIAVAVVAAAAVVASAGAAFAGAITTPAGPGPFVVSGDASGNPQSFKVVASGFTPGQNVFAEQCDGVPSTAFQWDPTVHCDNGGSNAPAIADGSGVATFNTPGPREFDPIKGVMPSGVFACKGLTDPDPSPAPAGGIFTNCQLRVSSNNATVTSDQVFLTLTLPSTPAPTTTTTTTTTTVPVSTGQNLTTCAGFEFFGTLTPPLAGNGAPTATVAQLKTTKAGIVIWLPGFGAAVDPINGFHITTAGTIGQPTQASCSGAMVNDDHMTVGAKLGGVASCVPNYTGPNADQQYPLNGKLALTNVAKTVKEQAYIRVTGFDTSAGPDIISITGIDVKGSMVGATVSGEVGFDPVVKALVNTPGVLPGPDGLYGPPIDAGSSADNTIAAVLKNQYYFDNNQAPPGTCGTTTPAPTGQPIGLIYGTDGTTLLGSHGTPISFDI